MGAETVKYISFSVQGDFVTKLAREKCYLEGNFDYAVNLLKGCMESDVYSENEILGMAVAILDGRAELRGTYPNEDYGFFHLDEKDPNWNLGGLFEDLYKKKKKADEDYKSLQTKYLFVLDSLSEWEMRSLNFEYREEYDELLFEGLENEESLPFDNNDILNDFVKRLKTDTDDDYGWLEPDGTFHPVEFAEHQSWADLHLREIMLEEDYMNLPYNKTGGDYFIERGWVLLHNPARGVASPTKSEIHEYTKAQKNFLHSYYIERGEEKKAREIWE